VEDLRRCRELIATYRDPNLGLADVGVIAVAERLGVSCILTIDQRDFRAVKAKKIKFVILPADA